MTTPLAIANDQTPADVRREHLGSEKRAREAGVVCFTVAFVFGVVDLLLLPAFFARLETFSALVVAGLFQLPTVGLFLIGRGLRRLEGWSRPVAIGASALLLMGLFQGSLAGTFLFGVGCILLVFVLRADRFVFSRTYREVISATCGTPPDFTTQASATSPATARALRSQSSVRYGDD